jgi:acyl-CoA dehydrogenase
MAALPDTTEETELLRAQVQRFVAERVLPHGDDWERDGAVPRDVLRDMGSLGLFGIRYPEKYGGAEMDTRTTAAFAEELGRSTYGGFAITVLVHTDMASPHLANAGSQEQKDKYMPGIVSGETIAAVAVTEPGAGSDVAGIRTRANRSGNGWVLNGSKMFITNGQNADVYFVAAKTDPDAKGSRGISMFIVDKGTKGFAVSRGLDKMGWRSSDTAELSFDECWVGAQAMGEAQKAIDLTLDYVRERSAFGGTLWDKQTIRQRLAMLQAEVAAARQLVFHAAERDAAGEDCVKDVSMAKALCGELVNKVMYSCQQFHGGFGYMREAPIERMVRDARVQSIGGGATEVMLEEVAKRM